MNKVPFRRSFSLVSLLSTAALAAALSGPVSAQAPDINSRVGDFSLLDQNGYFHHMSWYDNRKAIVLLVQANGSNTFRQALPTFSALHTTYKDNFQFFMLNPLGESRASVIDAVAAAGEEIPVLIDDAQVIAEAMNVQTAGEALIYDPRS
ncbi:MAG: hypothetical protein Q8L38_03775, partial [Pseudohongiella sp.]|nr:hypothetical protein [Pseudohongiella sp.]